MKNAIKRATIGRLVKADTSGLGDWIIGNICGSDAKLVHIHCMGDEDVVKVVRSAVEPAKANEVEDILENAKVRAKEIAAAKSARDRLVKVRAASGKSSLDNGDKTAEMLRGLTLTEAYKIVAKHLDVTQKSLKGKYSHLNEGMQRMNIGNRLRSHLKGNKPADAK